MRRVAAVLLVAGVLAGCASHPSETPWLVQRELNPPKSCEPLTADQELVLGVSQEMVAAGRRHAALANLERLPNSLPPVRLSKARLLRLLGHGSEAEALYSSLLGTCLVADARHGLGQLEAGRGNHAMAQRHLRAAASLAPANESIRNDLGVVYMNQRRLSEARFELLTAMELNENARRAPQNLLVLLIYQGNWQGARDLVSAKGLSSDDFARAEQRAKTMRTDDMQMALEGRPQPEGVAPSVTPVPAAHSATVVPVPEAVAAPAPAAAPARSTAPVAVPLRVAAPVLTPAPARVATPAPDAAPAPTPMSLAVAAQVWALEEDPAVGDAAQQIDNGQQPSAGAGPIVCRLSGASRLSVMDCLPK